MDILLENLDDPKHRKEFEKLKFKHHLEDEVEYDYTSIMHYGKTVSIMHYGKTVSITHFVKTVNTMHYGKTVTTIS